MTDRNEIGRPRIAILLTCFNRKEKTVACIKSLLAGNDGYDLRFLITDDNSSDGTVEAVEGLSKNIHVLHGDGNLFWNGGMRKGMSYAFKHNDWYDYVMLINDDVVFYPDIIEQLYHRLMENEGEVVVGSTEDKNGNTSYGGVIKTSKHFAKYRLQDPTNEPVFCDTFNCNCIFMSKEIFFRVGNLDKNYIHSMGDYDYGMKVTQKGMRIINSEKHVGSCEDNADEGTWRDATLPRGKRLKLKESPKGLPRKDWFYFVRKNYGLLPAIYHSITPYVRILVGK